MIKRNLGIAVAIAAAVGAVNAEPVMASSKDTNWGYYYIYATFEKSTSSMVYDIGPFPL